MIKKHILKVFVFLFNLSAVALGAFLIKSQSDIQNSPKTEKLAETVPISDDVLDMQNQIASDREAKLRDLNTSPKDIKKINTTTTTTTTTKTTKPSSSTSTKTS